MKRIVLNDLYDYKNRKIYQLSEAFKFSLDSILLAEYVSIKNKNQKIVDFCTGNAVVPLIISGKHENKIFGIEIQSTISDIANKSVLYNHLENQISIINDSVLEINKYFNSESVDIVTCNPPYFKLESTSLINENNIKAIARHEITINLEQIIKSAHYILKNNGYLYMVHRSSRLEEIIMYLNKYHFAVKEIQPIYTKENSDCELVIIKALKNGNMTLKIKTPIFTDKLNTYQDIFRK